MALCTPEDVQKKIFGAQGEEVFDQYFYDLDHDFSSNPEIATNTYVGALTTTTVDEVYGVVMQLVEERS